MKIILGAALLILVALLGSRKTFTRIKIPLAAKHIYLTGTEYIIVGWCLGSQALGLLDNATVNDLSPLLYLALGWIGLMFGSQLEISMIKRFPKQYFFASAVQAFTTVSFCLVPIAFYFFFIEKLPAISAIIGALALAAIAIPTGQSSLALVVNELKLSRGKLTDLLSYIAGTDMAFGVFVLGLVFCFARAKTATLDPLVAGSLYFVTSVGMGGVMGLMLHLLTRLRCTQEELLLFTIGLVVFSSGTAAFLGISPLFVTAIGGIVIANKKGAKERILRALTTLEKPFYIIILLIGGSLVDVSANWRGALLLAVVYFISRTTGKFLGGFTSSLVVKGPVKVPPTLGLGLVSQGGISAAMALSFYNFFGDEQAGTILFAVLVSIAINEFISPILVKPLIEKET